MTRAHLPPPITIATLGLAGGMYFALRAGTTVSASVVAALLAAFGFSVVRLGGSAKPALVLVLGWSAAGALLGLAAGTRAAADCRTRFADGAALELRAILEARPPADGPAFMRVQQLASAGDRIPCSGTIRARLSRDVPSGLAAGTRVFARGRWWRYPSQGSEVRRPEWTGTLMVDSLAIPPSPTASAISPTSPLLRMRDVAQLRLRRLFGDRSDLAEAVLLARREGLDPEVRDRFARAGMAHLLAISGLHVGVIAGTLLLIARMTSLPHGRAEFVAAGATLAYVAFLGFPHAAVRAATQALLFLGARALQRPADKWGILATAALVILVFDPLAILGAGFQLSFAGVAGILWIRPKILAHLPERGGTFLREGIATSAAATLATAPVAAIHFGQAAPIGLLANLPAIPLAAAAVPAVALSLVVGLISESAGTFLAGGATILLIAMDRIATAAAAVPFGHVMVGMNDVRRWTAALLLGAIVISRLPAERSSGSGSRGVRKPLQRLVGSGAALSLLLCWPALGPRLGSGHLEIHVMDVGQGDAVAIRSPAGRWMLVDAGPRSGDYDAGEARVIPYLLRQGANRIEFMVLTHPDADHIGGAAALLNAFPIRTVIDPAMEAGKSLYLETLADARSADVEWIAGREGVRFDMDGVEVELLAPHDSLVDAGGGTNEVSVVFRLSYGDVSALFMGDAYAAVERALVNSDSMGLRSTILKVGHHGSITSTSEELLRAARPEYGIIPVGRRNRFGHPHPVVLGRLREHGVRVLRTDLMGAIIIRISGSGDVDVETAQ